MSKVHFITEVSNKNKVTGIQNALKKAPLSDIYFDPIVSEQNEYKPLSIENIRLALSERVQNLFKGYECPMKNSLTYAIAVQKGVNLKDNGDELKLICAVMIVAEDESKISLATNSVTLPEEIRTLVIEKNMDLYDAYGEIFGDDIKNKKMSLYEKITGKSEASWIEETVLKALTF